ncbi:GNAT family N-acetyltransferase [Paenibacillus bovis]|uniref:GCN5 family acetyltransferase n=1 Tax=Paenibacillus bovis TaxID=1616788 RepID=A0A172ZI48_9BACL|nr:GNAT family N-acetyltransferase [Paenibacillus bovis]ANF97315.1 GCN5 family acetyltransferase [Paenibacillus bovis]
MMNMNNRFVPKEEVLIIDGEDIILREFADEDLDALHMLTWQPEIYRYLPGWNVSREVRADWLVNYEIPENRQFLNAVLRGEDTQDLYLRLAIFSKKTGELIGWCCTGIKSELPSPNREIVYAISKDYRGKGYATQAVQGMIMYLFANTNLPLLNAVALTENTASCQVIRKSGFTLQDTIHIEGEEYHHYVLDRQSWAEHIL